MEGFAAWGFSKLPAYECGHSRVGPMLEMGPDVDGLALGPAPPCSASFPALFTAVH